MKNTTRTTSPITFIKDDTINNNRMNLNKKHAIILAILTISIFIIRILIAFSQPGFTYESYFHLRHIESIKETGLPLLNDPLSYGGRELRFLPLFHYLIAALSLILPLHLAAILLPNLFLALVPLIIYVIVQKITTNQHIPLICASMSAILPFLFNPNSVTPETLFIPLFLLTLYAFLNLEQPHYPHIYTLLFIATTLTSSATILLILGFALYLLLCFIENRLVPKQESEIVLFSLFFFVWSQLLFFKETFLTQGLSFIWQNIPPQIIQQYFPTASLLQVIASITIIPFIAGTVVVYKNLFQGKNAHAILLISFALVTSILTFFRFMKLSFALALFSIILTLLFAFFYEELATYLHKTKMSRKTFFLPIITSIILAITILPATIGAIHNQQIPTTSEIEAFQWLENSTPQPGGVLALLEEGHLVTYFSKKPNVMDDQFLLIDNVEERFNDLHSLYTTSFQTQAIDLLQKYQIRYLVLSPRAQEIYGIQNFRYFDPACFVPIYNKEVKIYKVTCTIEQKTPPLQ